MIVLAHVLIAVPFAIRSILAAYNRIDLELLNVASTLKAARGMLREKVAKNRAEQESKGDN